MIVGREDFQISFSKIQQHSAIKNAICVQDFAAY